jgi:hypothetical protein
VYRASPCLQKVGRWQGIRRRLAPLPSRMTRTRHCMLQPDACYLPTFFSAADLFHPAVCAASQPTLYCTRAPNLARSYLLALTRMHAPPTYCSSWCLLAPQPADDDSMMAFATACSAAFLCHPVRPGHPRSHFREPSLLCSCLLARASMLLCRRRPAIPALACSSARHDAHRLLIVDYRLFRGLGFRTCVLLLD